MMHISAEVYWEFFPIPSFSGNQSKVTLQTQVVKVRCLFVLLTTSLRQFNNLSFDYNHESKLQPQIPLPFLLLMIEREKIYIYQSIF